MKITDDVRRFAAQQGISEEAAIEVGSEEKPEEFKQTGAKVYAKA